MSVITARGLGKRYGELVAVDDVSFRVHEAGSVAIVGESGSGKTTIARMIVGLERPTGGTISACGHDRSRPARSVRDRRRRGREVQIVFQDPYTSLDPRQNAEDAIAEVLRLHHGWPAERRRARVAELTELVGLDERQSRALPRSLSGGQRQRVAIARAMILKPRLVVLDEPTSALDRAVQTGILALLEQLQEAHGLTYVFISHDLAVIRAVADEIAVMKDGRIVEQGAANEIVERPREPYTRTLIAAAFQTGE